MPWSDILESDEQAAAAGSGYGEKIYRDRREMPMPLSVRRGAAALAAIATLSAGCAANFPGDAQGTLERASGGTLYVGVAENPPWTVIEPDDSVSGSEAALVREYAESIDADIEWAEASESVLAERIGRGELDLVIGGFTAQSPWAGDMALTRPYMDARAEDGSTDKMVMGVLPGENALQISLETFLAEQAGEL